MTKGESMSKDDRRAMMQSMMEQIFGGMSLADKKEMCATMMSKMTEGVDMKKMMPDMMSKGTEGGQAGMPDMMSKMMQGGHHQQMSQMPEMMLKMMMPHCIGMMLPSIDPDKRGEVAGAILSAIVDKGCSGMSEAQGRSFRQDLNDILNPKT